jgi:hypothetical protein
MSSTPSARMSPPTSSTPCRRSPRTAARARGPSRSGGPSAGKTGTSEERKSVWFSGYTPQLATSVAMYKDVNGTPAPLTGIGGLDELSGNSFPLSIWIDFMKGALDGEQKVDFPKRAGIGDDKVRTVAPPAPATSAPAVTTDPTQAPPAPTVEPTVPAPTQTPTKTVGPTIAAHGRPSPAASRRRRPASPQRPHRPSPLATGRQTSPPEPSCPAYPVARDVTRPPRRALPRGPRRALGIPGDRGTARPVCRAAGPRVAARGGVAHRGVDRADGAERLRCAGTASTGAGARRISSSTCASRTCRRPSATPISGRGSEPSSPGGPDAPDARAAAAVGDIVRADRRGHPRRNPGDPRAAVLRVMGPVARAVSCAHGVVDGCGA